MAVTGPNLRVRISADLRDIRQGLGLLRGELATIKKQANQAAPDASKWSAGLAVIRRQLVGIASVYTAVRAAGSFVRLADEAANLSGRLRLVTKSQREFARAQQQTFRIAQDTSAEWGSIVELYAQLAQTTGMGQEKILALTKTVSQAFVVSGANAQTTANGLRQLQQAMAGGILRAEEFNTINETGSRIVQALADHFGIAFSDVRKYVNAGKVSSQDFATALLKASGDIQEDFNKMPLTVERATQQVRNALLKLVGDTDQASGASADLATAIAGLARVLESDDTKRGFGEMVNGLAQIITAATSAANWVGQVSRKIKELSGVGLGTALKALVMAGSGNTAGAIAAIARARAPEVAGPDQQTGPLGGNSPESMVTETTKAIGGLADASTLARDAIARQMAALDLALEDGEVGLVEFYARKKELQLADIDLQIRAAQAEATAAKTAEQRSKALTELAKLQRDRAGIGPAIAREMKDAQESLAKEVGDIYQRIFEAQGETGRARIAELEAEFQALIIKLQAEGDDAGVAIVRKLINIEAARAQIEQFQEEMQRITGGLGDKEASVGAQVGAGMMGSVEGEQALQDARKTSLEQLLALRQRTSEYLATLNPESPEAAAALSFMTILDTNIGTVASSMDRLRNQTKEAAIDSVTNLFMDLVEGSKSAGAALKDFVRGFALAMAQIAARALATMLVLQLMDALWPGSADLVVAGSKASAGVHHGGGIAGAASRIRHNLNPMVFGGAPRYHSGGIAGLGPNEVPAILERGEEVLPRTDPRHRDNDNGRRETLVKTPVVVFGEQELANALAGHAGEQMIITHVRNNRKAIDM